MDHNANLPATDVNNTINLSGISLGNACVDDRVQVRAVHVATPPGPRSPAARRR